MTNAIPKEMASAREKVAARIENDDINTCPMCKNAYVLSEANGVPVLTCVKDRVVMPRLG